ncbi:MAG TPA: hypothetical protein VMS17_07765 [Gemmataceae bacterium]|nr:hypothetical protein [Gemmataceae bacterium]
MNPFEALRLDPSSSEEDVVKRAAQLRQRAADEAELTAVRQAVQALTGRPEDRLLHALLTHPRPDYAAPALERFSAAYRRAPAPPGEPPPVPGLDLKEFTELLQAILVEELDLTPPPFEAPAAGEDPDELRRQMGEALWQSLVFDPRA